MKAFELAGLVSQCFEQRGKLDHGGEYVVIVDPEKSEYQWAADLARSLVFQVQDAGIHGDDSYWMLRDVLVDCFEQEVEDVTEVNVEPDFETYGLFNWLTRNYHFLDQIRENGDNWDRYDSADALAGAAQAEAIGDIITIIATDFYNRLDEDGDLVYDDCGIDGCDVCRERTAQLLQS